MPDHPASRSSAPIRARSAHAAAGFTLAEVLVVLLLVGLMVVLAAPRLDVNAWRTDAAMRAVGSRLLAAQRAAVTRQHPVVVSIDEDARAVRVHYDRDADLETDAGEAVMVEPLEAGVVFGRGGAPPEPRVGPGPVSFRYRHGGRPAVVFHRNGSASEEGGFYLTSARAAREDGHAADTRAVVVERATGRPGWASYREGAWRREF